MTLKDMLTKKEIDIVKRALMVQLGLTENIISALRNESARAKFDEEKEIINALLNWLK